jgi:hypothetical protein
LKIDSVDQKFNRLECGNFSQDAGTPGTERVITFSQLAVKGLKKTRWGLEWVGWRWGWGQMGEGEGGVWEGVVLLVPS